MPSSPNQFRYSRQSVRSSVLAAVGLTVIVSFLVWLFSRLLGFQQAGLITLVSGLIFFGFCSAAMIWRFLRQEVVLAIRPDGLFDARFSSQAVPWDDIKDIRLGRAENDFELGVYLWPDKMKPNGKGEAQFSIDLAPLDASVDVVLEAVSAHKQISMEQS